MLNRSFTPFPTLTTKRLALRQLQLTDHREIFTLRSDAEINKYLDRPASKSLEDAKNFIEKVTENIKNNNSLYWAITVTESDVFVGTICLYGFSDEKNTCEIGYELLTNFQGQGIMKEAVEKVIDYAFTTIQVEEIEAYLHRDNQRSVQLLEKLPYGKLTEPDPANPELICYHLRNTVKS